VSFSSLTVGFRKYCDSKCAIEYLKNTFVCKVHGKINPDRMKETFTNKGHCIRCRDCDINEIKKSRNKKKKPIICKICKVAFSNISSGSPVVCSEECRIEYKKITGRKFFLKYKEELPDHYVNRLSRGEKLPPDFLEIAKLNIRLKRKIKEIKENEKC
jgi:hypothetical protein